MKAIMNFFRWLGKHWALSTMVFLIVAITATTIICWNVFGKEKVNEVPIYITVSGLGEGKDMSRREYIVDEFEALDYVFSPKYEDIYEDFDQPLIANNTFRTLLGVSPSGSKRFYVTIGSTADEESTTTDANNLTQSYIYSGCDVVIEYR